MTNSIKNETPNMTLGDRAPECRFRRQFPHTEIPRWTHQRRRRDVAFWRHSAMLSVIG
jgi:hypothetical protein